MYGMRKNSASPIESTMITGTPKKSGHLARCSATVSSQKKKVNVDR
jgi:hypothetical protein